MYFAYGWPKALAVGDAGFKQDVVSLGLDSDSCLIVFTGSAQLWAGGQHRVRLGTLERSEESIKAEGLNKHAYWCSRRRLLAVLVNMQRFFRHKKSSIGTLAVHNRRALFADIQQLPAHLWNAHLQRVHIARCWHDWHARLETRGHVSSAQHCCPVCSSSNFNCWGQPVNLAGLVRRHLPGFLMAGQGVFFQYDNMFTACNSFPDACMSFCTMLTSCLSTCTALAPFCMAGEAASALQFRGQYNPFGSLTERQLRLQRSMSLRSQRSSLQPIAVNSHNSFNSQSRHLVGSAGVPASSSPSSTTLGARQVHRATSTDRLSRTSSTSTVPDSICIDALDYAPALKMLGVVLADGRCAICRTADSGLAPAEQLEFSHWICGVGSGATCLCMAPDAQLVAVGLTSGEVALYKLYGHKGGRFSIDGSQAEAPVRVVSLLDWGYGPEATGSVAELKWSPDNRAFAVSASFLTNSRLCASSCDHNTFILYTIVNVRLSVQHSACCRPHGRGCLP